MAASGVVPGGTERNLEHAAGFTDFSDTAEPIRIVLADAQTSGGLLIAVAPDRVGELRDALRAEQAPAAAVIGRIVDGPSRVTVHG